MSCALASVVFFGSCHSIVQNIFSKPSVL